MNSFFNRISVPFTIPELFRGFAEAHGILRVDEDALVLELQVQDSIFGFLKSEIKHLRIGYDEIENISMRKKCWRRSLLIHTNSLRFAATIPGNNKGYIALQIHRRDRMRAEEAISRLSLHVSESKLKQIENWF